jgi:hypothetical protein
LPIRLLHLTHRQPNCLKLFEVRSPAPRHETLGSIGQSMTTDITRADETKGVRSLLAMVVLVGTALNGLAVHAVRATAGEGGGGLLLGVSPFDLVALVAGAVLVWQGRDKLPNPTGWLEAVVLVALLVPSSAVAWSAAAVYAAVLAWRSEGPVRLGAGLFVALAATSLWAAIGVPMLQGPIGVFEANIVALLAGLVWEGVNRPGFAGGSNS